MFIRKIAPSFRTFYRFYSEKRKPCDVKNSIDFKTLKHRSKVPKDAVKCIYTSKSEEKVGCPTNYYKIDSKTLQLLERLSLVDLDSKQALQSLQEGIKFAARVLAINTDCVKPMYTVLENLPLRTRPDIVADGNIKEAILKNAKLTEDDYFVAPPGNIPLEQKEKKFDD